jgi:hypothetical protein
MIFTKGKHKKTQPNKQTKKQKQKTAMAVSFIGGENRSTTAIFEIQQKDDNENNSFAFFVFFVFCLFETNKQKNKNKKRESEK